MLYLKAKMHQIRFRLLLRSDPAGGARSTPPGPLAGFKGFYFWGKEKGKRKRGRKRKEKREKEGEKEGDEEGKKEGGIFRPSPWLKPRSATGLGSS